MSEQILEIGKIRKALKSFNQTIRVDVNTIGAKQEDKEPETEKELISKVKLNFLDDEWGETVEALAEAGLDLEEEEAEKEWLSKITINVQIEIDPDITLEDLKKGNFRTKATPNGKKSFIVKILKKENKTEIKVKTRIPYIAFIKDDALGKVIEEIRKIEKEHSCNYTLLDVEIN